MKKRKIRNLNFTKSKVASLNSINRLYGGTNGETTDADDDDLPQTNSNKTSKKVKGCPIILDTKIECISEDC